MAELAETRRLLTRLRRDLDRDLVATRDLLESAGADLLVDDLVEDLDRQLQRMRGAAVITLVGATGAGKSTMLNALAGHTIAIEGETRPTTSAPVIYRPADADVSSLLADLPGAAPRIVDYDTSIEGPWREQILIDAPDVNSIAHEHREVVRVLADRSDVLVVVAHRQSVAELAVAEFLDPFAGRRGLLFVLNRADELTQDSQRELLDQLRGVARDRFAAEHAPVLAVSARQAQMQPDSPAWTELCSHLKNLVQSGELGRVRRLNAMGTVQSISDRCAQLMAEREAKFTELETAVVSGLERWQARVEQEVHERLELRQPHLRGLLWNETARRWDGPGGLALRVGGLTTVGLGAGAALARRNPLLAAGAALGSMAAERARDALRQRHFSEAAGLLPGEEELRGWYRDEMGSARLLALELSGDALGMGVPSDDTLIAGAITATDEAWGRLVDRDILAAASGVARWFLRWPIDLPVYAMLGWVVWIAARGFWQGDYVGVDLLLNVALILGAWLLVTRTLVRGLLGARSRALLKTTRTAVTRSLESALQRIREASTQSLADRRAALQRLASLAERWRKQLLD